MGFIPLRTLPRFDPSFGQQSIGLYLIAQDRKIAPERRACVQERKKKNVKVLLTPEERVVIGGHVAISACCFPPTKVIFLIGAQANFHRHLRKPQENKFGELFVEKDIISFSDLCLVSVLRDLNNHHSLLVQLTMANFLRKYIELGLVCQHHIYD